MSGTARVHALLGMHRSGTSMLAGSLEVRGLAFGEVNEKARYNAKGTRENEALQAIHVGVLRDSGGTWSEPPRRVVWSDSRRASLHEFIADMDSRFERWGFKDPRTLLFLDEWQRQVPDLALVGIYRHPEAVARSLAKREFSPLPRRQAIKLWRVYNERLVAAHRVHPFTIIRFDVPPAELLAAVDRVAEEWRLDPPDPARTFFDDELVYEHSGVDQPVPRSCRRIWDYLVERTVRVA